MILYEYEGKKLLTSAGIKVPNSQLLTSPDEDIMIPLPVVLKAQVLSGKRADVGGIIRIRNNALRMKDELQNLFGKTINKEKVEQILVEEMVEIDREFYVSISYDTDTRGPILSISEQGGTGIEGREVQTYPIDPLTQTVILGIRRMPETPESSTGFWTSQNDIIQKLIKLFFEQDCLLLEVNPLVLTKGGPSTGSATLTTGSLRTNSSEGIWMAVDAKIKLDDFAKARHADWDFPPRAVPGYTPTPGEIAAKKIDEGNYRGTAGSSYFDLEGDIAVLSSGGGVSLTALDALIAAGGQPANFTEYSGNPPKEKVVKLTKIVLDKPNIHGLWVIGTVVANFTDIYETLSGLLEGLRQAQSELGRKFNFPIVIRRGGPRDEEAFTMLRQIKEFDLHLQGPDTSITQSAEIMAKLAKEFAQKGEENE